MEKNFDFFILYTAFLTSRDFIQKNTKEKIFGSVFKNSIDSISKLFLEWNVVIKKKKKSKKLKSKKFMKNLRKKLMVLA